MKMMRSFSLLFVLGFISSTVQGASPSIFFLLQQLARSQPANTDIFKIPVSDSRWGEWTQWSMCTTTTVNGMRVRSRACEIGSCDRISGENYEVETCTPHAPNATVQNETFIDKCRNDPTMNNTLSCRLYRENPVMAYGIYRSAGEMDCDENEEEQTDGQPKRCLFKMGGDAPDGETVESIITESTTPSSTSSLRRRQEDQSLIEKIKEESRIGAECKESCRVSAAVRSSLNQSENDTLTSAEEATEQALNDENEDSLRECLQNCRKTKLNEYEANHSDEYQGNPKLSVHSRKKRSILPEYNSDNYRSPCYERTELSTNPHILNLDDSEGELYFYEGQEQRFIRKRCAGRQIGKGIFFPQELVTQERTKMLAICKQGYLNRYGLLIQLHPEGDFSFNNGERFSVRFRPFKLESHCSLSIYQKY